MTQSLKLGGADTSAAPKIRRLNRLPIIGAIVLVVIFLGVIFYGLTSRGLRFRDVDGAGAPGSQSASTYADQLTHGVPDDIIGEPVPPRPPTACETATSPFPAAEAATQTLPQPATSQLEPEEVWRARLEREQREQYLRGQAPATNGAATSQQCRL